MSLLVRRLLVDDWLRDCKLVWLDANVFTLLSDLSLGWRLGTLWDVADALLDYSLKFQE